MTIAVRSKGGSGGSSASAAGSAAGFTLITAGDLLRTFFGIFVAEAQAARCHNVWIYAQPASTLPQLPQKNVLQ